MKKTIYLMLALLMTSWMSADAQVRIGGDNNPNESAILDLNESDKQTDGTKGLALPRVALTSSTTWGLEGDTPVDGMTVYNTSTSKENGLQGEGVYTWTGGKTGEWKSPSLTRSSVTVVNGGAALEGGDEIFFSQQTKSPAAFVAVFNPTRMNQQDAAAWCASLGYRLPIGADWRGNIRMSREWVNLFFTTSNTNASTTITHNNSFWLADKINYRNSAWDHYVGYVDANDVLQWTYIVHNSYTASANVVCVKDL